MSGLELLAPLCCLGGYCGWQCSRRGAQDSCTWPEAPFQKVRELYHYCQLNLAAYIKDLDELQRQTSLLVEEDLLQFAEDSRGRMAPLHMTYIDHERREVCLVFRGLNLAARSDYRTLMNRQRRDYKGHPVHAGMLGAAEWVLRSRGEELKVALGTNAGYRLTVVGHSLGAGVAALVTMMVVDKPEMVGLSDSGQIRCFLFAPPRVVGCKHAIDYCNVISSVVLQDDFFPRVDPRLVQRMFLGATGVGLLFMLLRACLQDFFVSTSRRIGNPDNLYPPGRLFHIVYKDRLACGTVPPTVRHAIPLTLRFDKLVMSQTAATDHHIRNYHFYLRAAVMAMVNDGHGGDAEEDIVRPVAEHFVHARNTAPAGPGDCFLPMAARTRVHDEFDTNGPCTDHKRGLTRTCCSLGEAQPSFEGAATLCPRGRFNPRLMYRPNPPL